MTAPGDLGVGHRVLAREAGHDGGHLGLGLGRRGARREAPLEPHPAVAAALEQGLARVAVDAVDLARGVDLVDPHGGHPEVGDHAGQEAREARRGDPHHLVGLAVEAHGRCRGPRGRRRSASARGRRRAPPPARRPGAGVVGRQERAAPGGLDAERLEGVAGDQLADQHLALPVVLERGDRRGVPDQGREGVDAVLRGRGSRGRSWSRTAPRGSSRRRGRARPARSTGSGRSRMELTKLNRVALTPMPRPSVSRATAVKSGARPRVRRVWRISRNRSSMSLSSSRLEGSLREALRAAARPGSTQACLLGGEGDKLL